MYRLRSLVCQRVVNGLVGCIQHQQRNIRCRVIADDLVGFTYNDNLIIAGIGIFRVELQSNRQLGLGVFLHLDTSGLPSTCGNLIIGIGRFYLRAYASHYLIPPYVSQRLIDTACCNDFVFIHQTYSGLYDTGRNSVVGCELVSVSVVVLLTRYATVN